MKQTRVKTVWFFGICLFIIAMCSIFTEMNGVALSATVAIAGIVAYYTQHETNRKSDR